MAVQSRSRAPRNSDGSSASSNTSQHASKADRHSRPAAPPPTNHHHLHHHTTPSFHDGGPPAKRRKLSIRSKQTTLDQYATALSAPPKPPTRVSVAQPHGRLLQNLNGVQTVLDTREDELSQPASGVATPQPKRVPKPALHLTTTEPAKHEEKRTLRSQDDGPRLKSELSIYFPNYEDIIFDAPKEPEFITVDSTLYVTEDTTKPKAEHTTSPKSSKNAKTSPSHTRKTSTNGIPPTTTSPHQRTFSNQFNGSPSLNLEMIARSLPHQPEDPLTEAHYLKSHRRAERKEKQLRNIEKERAMHEKVQLDRILEGLQGHDWLKVLGITGITDGEAKKFEGKREYFIAEVKTLVEKFKRWKEQERRQKVEKETPVPMKEEEEEEEEEYGEEEYDEVDSEQSSVGPPSSDLNASAARQLQLETAIALKSLNNTSKATSTSTGSSYSNSNSKGKEPTTSTSTTSNNKNKNNTTNGPTPHQQNHNLPTAPQPPPPLPLPPEDPITSFYTKPHLRAAALGKARHGRKVWAFGHAVPEMQPRDFELPEDIGRVREEVRRSNAREKRRRKRGRREGEEIGNGAGG